MKGIKIYFGPDGIAREYDDTNDVTIHCETKEDQEEVIRMLTNFRREAQGLPPAEPTEDQIRKWCYKRNLVIVDKEFYNWAVSKM